MTFSELSKGDIFTYQEIGLRRLGLKLSDKDAWSFHEKAVVRMAHNRKVWPPDATDGRLMRASDGRLCIMHPIGDSGTLAGFRIIPEAFIEGPAGDFTPIVIDTGESRVEVDIILSKISQSRKNTEILLAALKVLLQDIA